MAEGEVIFRRIVGIELAKRAGDFLGRLPRQGLATREAEVSAELVDVRVDRNE